MHHDIGIAELHSLEAELHDVSRVHSQGPAAAPLGIQRSHMLTAQNADTRSGGQKFCASAARRPRARRAWPDATVDSNDMSGEARSWWNITRSAGTGRWTILFRSILAFPLFFVRSSSRSPHCVSQSSLVRLIVHGRVPDGLQTFITGTMRLYANILAYVFLLTSRWPAWF